MFAGRYEDVLRTYCNDGLKVEVTLLSYLDGFLLVHLLTYLAIEDILQRIHANDTVFKSKNLKISQLQCSGTNET